ncbi:hypothetical protein TWF481_003609 [Arthrobotrys musiformis]|uniref:BTB domain-containing protein n=1 Tax=Arthrobotrys musiformis TaxID=47236 RepID=A0AAV9WH39_9PEZI
MPKFYRGNDIPENRKLELNLNHNSEVLIVDQYLLRAKCPMISSVLDFQEAMSPNKDEERIKTLELPRIKLAAIEVIIDWMFTGIFSLPYEYHSSDMTIPDICHAAALLQLTDLLKTVKSVVLEDIRKLKEKGTGKIQNPTKLLEEINKFF